MVTKILIAGLMMSFIFLRLYLRYNSKAVFIDGDKIRITAKVRSETLRFEKSQYLKIKGYKIYLPLYPQVDYGDGVVIEGVIEGEHLRKARLVKVVKNTGLFYDSRKKLINVYSKSLPPEEAALISGMVIGSKQKVTADFWERLKRSGTAHVVVASGMNVTLVAGFLMNFLARIFSRKKAVPLVLAGIWSYSIIAGLDAPIIRAAIMGTIAFMGQMVGRLYFALRALIFTGFIMIVVNPDWIFDVGFILSFVATISLILFMPKVNKFLLKRKLLRNVPLCLVSDLSSTLSAQIGVVPVLVYYFGQFNFFSPIINAFVLWTVPLITVIGFIGGFMGLISITLGKPLLLLSYPLLKWFIEVVSLA